MREFFKPWRRKVGVMTLVMSCLFMVGWVRSFTFTDYLGIRFNKAFAGMKFFAIQSHRGEVGWQDLTMFETYIPTGWSAIPINSSRIKNEQFMLAFATVPYWSITVPLTLISLWLLLTTPKKSTQTKTTLPIQDEGGGAS